MIRLANGDFLIEFASEVGAEYAVEYSSDLIDWKRVTPTITAVANRTQWTDNAAAENGKPSFDRAAALLSLRHSFIRKLIPNKFHHMKAIFCLLALSPGFALGGDFISENISGDSSRNARSPYFTMGGGMMWRNIGKTNLSPDFAIGAPFLRLPGGVDSASAPGNRTYDNGFVNIGAATPLTGLTTNFGYTGGPPQVGGNLEFRRSGGAAVGLPTGGSDDADTAPAPYLDFSYVIPVRADLEIGFNLNFAFTGLDGRFGSNVGLSSVTTVDTFALNGVIVPAGTYNGPFGGAAL